MIRIRSRILSGRAILVRVVLATLLLCGLTCNRRPRLSDEAYREAVTAFHTALAAMQTSQDVLARGEMDRLTQIAPWEPAGWANSGLLLLRQQQIDEGGRLLARAAELAPANAPIARLLALSESLKGNLAQSTRHWRRAVQLDPGDLKAPFALAQELERQGGAENEREAQQILGALASGSGNLAARLEFARLAAKRGDGASLQQALDALARSSASWPSDAQERLRAVREAAARRPADATTPVIFLKNVLLRTPEYRAAYAAVSTPRSEVGEPLVRLVAIENPDPRPAPPDETLTFSAQTEPLKLTGGAWAGAVSLTGDAAPVLVAASGREVVLASGASLPFPGGTAFMAPGLDGVLAADLNYDFRTDLVLAGAGGLRIFRQTDTSSFADVTRAAKLPNELAAGPLYGAWAADIDTDGDLDLLAARQTGAPVVLRNNGDGTFAQQNPFSGAGSVRGFVWADIDGEGVPDAILLDDRGAVRVFLNLRGAAFRELQVPPGFAGLVAIAAAEASGDGIIDGLGLTASGSVVRLARQPAGTGWQAGQVAVVEAPPALALGQARLLVADVDNNAAADLIVAGSDGSRVLLGGDGGTFRPLRASVPVRVTGAADMDGNGRVDLIGPDASGARIAKSQGQKNYHWQAIRMRAATATGDQRVNSFGIGGEVEIRSGLHAQKQVIGAPIVHFGLGESTRAEVARITWPNGVLQSEFDLKAGSVIAASQRLKGSCPWLFAWNGRDMGFVTDFIWRSPLGLRINAQATADVLMTEDWVRIRGDQLAPRNGAYDLRITAELWETHFFDLLSLLVVDHPVGTEIFVDERFAVPPPRLSVIATSPVQEFAVALDDSARDIRDTVRARDDRHLDFAGRGAYQGVTRDHFVELELPEAAPRTGPLFLVAQGWIHPTDSSINVAIGQGDHARPAGLSLQVADARGRFSPARTGLGFPAGKDKTILIDVTGIFHPHAPRRVRLATNLEIFWDRLGWAVGRPDVRLETRRIEVASADLRYRGFSVTEQKEASTPERPRYVLEGTAPRWRDLEGFHTRFGDVRELLQAVEDRYVIMNAGDELAVTFPEAPPAAPGMTRDFVLIGDGWEKDGDYNTTASRTVLPLPSHRWATYAERPGKLEDDPVYRQHPDDFERYHTRYVSPEAARDALRVRIDPNHP